MHPLKVAYLFIILNVLFSASVTGCMIAKDVNSRLTSIWGTATTAFHCSRHTGSANRDVYVIGIYGNHFSEFTLVNVESSSDVTKPLLIVLASHYPIKWKVKHKNLPISEIILVRKYIIINLVHVILYARVFR